MKKLTGLLLGSTLLFGAVACDSARTSADAPSDIDDGAAVVENKGEVEETLEDAASDIRQEQLDSDIRAREQRNDIAGNQEVRADSDLESEVRAKLEANIPRSKLTVSAKGGKVDIVGTVPSQEEYDSIPSLAQEITGVDDVSMTVEVIPSNES